MKQVIFNVGGALASYTEFYGKSLIIDLGKSESFHPVSDFLVPLYKKRGALKNKDGKYSVDQLLISHPHNDHISGIKEFDESFWADLITCPNDNDGMGDRDKVNWDLFDKNDSIKTLREMIKGRTPPLRATHEQNEFIYFLPPVDVEESTDLSNESYCNNVSLAVFLIIKNHRVFFPGDLQKLGVEKIVQKHHYLKNKLIGGVDVLVAPHHGLRSSFSTSMFSEMKNGKTRCLNIVPEKSNTDDSREVDGRYSQKEYCDGKNNLGTSGSPSYQVKTSRGHLLIDYTPNDQPSFQIITDADDLVAKFLEI